MHAGDDYDGDNDSSSGDRDYMGIIYGVTHYIILKPRHHL